MNETILRSVDRRVTLHDGSHPGQFWKAQRDICRALVDPVVTTVAVPAGHSVGKSFVAGRIILAWCALFRESMVLSTGPSNTQIEEVLWKEVRRSFSRSVLRSRGRITANPQRVQFGSRHALGYSTNRAERLQGHHEHGPLLALVDEASGVEDPEVWEVIASLKPQKRLLLGNPLRPDGPFYDACQRAEHDPAVRLIRIQSIDSPDIDQEHSERGLADAAWLREMRAEYGEDGLVWKVRVLAQFPGDAFDSVFQRLWLDLAFRTIHVPKGPNRLAMDLGLGGGGDSTVLIVADSNGVYCCESSNTMSLEKAAERAKALAERFHIEPHRITYDVEGIGADFNNRLESVGLRGCQPFRAGGGGTKKFFNLRTGAAWRCRQRLDPNYQTMTAPGVFIPQVPFSMMKMPERSKQLLRRELQELRYELKTSQTALEDAESYKKRLKRSPDHQACFCQLWAFMN